MKKDKKINESLIGKIIYGFLMFAPLLAIMFTSLYATFNPNAKDSYSGTQTQIDVSYQYETNEVNSVDDLIVGNIYKFTNYIPSLNSDFYTTSIYKLKRVGSDVLESFTSDTLLINESDYMIFKTNAIYVNTNGQDIYLLGAMNDAKFYFIYFGHNTTYSIDISNVTKSDYLGEPIIEETQVDGTLDNAFYYALDKTEDSTLFNWSKNTGIYTVLYNTCNGLGITTTFIPFILTYWLFISLIYLIYDLVLVFVHIAHKKVHEIEDF